MNEKQTQITVTQRRGLSHKPEAQRLILKGLGLRRIGHSVTVRDTRGREIEAACGQLHAQLAGRELPATTGAGRGARVAVAP